ncbi:MAG: substrate-binding domain-containing protein [Lachnospiraceae bacterium]|nr:substrate-binding domain-containing protein [Lachnospiraceae bacterium]
MRTEYSVNAMKDAGVEMEKLGYARANWNRAQAQTQVSSLLDTYGDRIELILSNNDDMALGAVDALKAAGTDKENWPLIVGIDGTGDGLAAVKKKELTGTVYNDKEGQAQGMADVCYALAAGEDMSSIGFTNGRYIRLPYRPITAENVSG